MTFHCVLKFFKLYSTRLKIFPFVYCGISYMSLTCLRSERDLSTEVHSSKVCLRENREKEA